MHSQTCAVRIFATVVWLIITVMWLGGSAANADCSVEGRWVSGKYFLVIRCDESQEAIDDAIWIASEPCTTLAPEFQTSCQNAVAESFRVRREAMLRRALKEGASVTAAAQLYGYTEEEVVQWIDKNTSLY